MALNAMYNWAKNVYKNPKGHEHDLLSICCITKTLMGWNFLKVANTCRERCGGMGYLSVARFGEYIAVAHTCLTAEGDNRVLMTKIVKDYMTNVGKKLSALPEPKLKAVIQIGLMNDVTPLEVLSDLLKFREKTLYQSLMKRMAELSKNGKDQF